jgi:glycosyltransferase involved in cell wall biosynthesis
MSDVLEIDAAARHASRPPKLKIAFVADQFSPPVFDGSTFVYKNWIDFLGENYNLYAIFFSSYGGDADAAHRYLAERCEAHVILPGAPRSRSWKILRAASRLATGTVFAPRWIEELGRGAIHRVIADFIQCHDLRLFLVGKLASVPLFGEVNFRRPDACFFLDAHDDFVARERQDREALTDLFASYPDLRDYPRFRDMRLRQMLSRLALRRARAQEARLCALFDCVLSSSPGEHAFYEAALAGIVPSVHLGWPPRQEPSPLDRAASAPLAPFDVGFIGGDYPFNVAGILFFCTEILPLIRRSRPNFTVLIAGHVARPLAHLGRHWPGVEVCGYLPDAQSFYDRVRAIVVPLLSGTGVSIKTLDALDRGKPVVSTRVGARGLADCTLHPRLFIADEVEDFAAKVLALCDGTETAERWDACSARALSPETVLAISFRSAFEKLLQGYGRTGELDVRCNE